jgi:predicted ATPase
MPGQRVREVLAGLVGKSILIAEEHRFGPRHRMLETIAEFARARLSESGERHALRRRHRDWCERLALRMRHVGRDRRRLSRNTPGRWGRAFGDAMAG